MGGQKSKTARLAHSYICVISAVGMAISNLSVSAQARDVLLLAGGGFAFRSFSQYTGAIIPLNNTKGVFPQEGPMMRFWQKTFAFSYTAELTPNNPAETRIDAFGGGFTGELGYRKELSQGQLAGYIGLSYRQFRLSPKDPGADLNNNPIGIPLTLEGNWSLFEKLSVASSISYTAFQKDYWAQLKVGYQPSSSPLRLGPEVVLQGGSEYQYLRLGAFISGIRLGNTYLGFNIGLRDDLRENRQSLYGDVNLSFFY